MRARDLLRHAPAAVDQGLSSASNFLLALLVAQSSSASDFGRFAIATSVYWLFLGGLRALIAEPLLILQARHGGSGRDLSAAVGLALDFAVIGSLVGATLVLVAGVGPVAVLLVSLPALIWQDLLRYCAFSLGRPGEALLSDGIWLASLLAIGGLVLLLPGAPTVSQWILLWAGCAVVPSLAASARTGVWPALSGQGIWWKSSRRQALPMLGDFAVLSVSTNLFVFLLPLVTSFALLGQMKASQVVNGPLSVLMTATALVALPTLARRRQAEGVVPLRAGLLIGAAMAVVAGSFGVALLLLPPAWGERLFGASWVGIGVLPALLAFQAAVQCINQGALMLLRAIGETRRLLVARIALAPVGLIVPLTAARWGATVLGAALIGMSAMYCTTWWVIAVRTARRVSRDRPATVTEPVSR